jgi:hypothetical protein
MSLALIAHEIEELARLVTDKAIIANFINKVHGTKYHASDIEKIQMGLHPTQSIPRSRAGVTVNVGSHLPLTPPLTTTNDNGIDPLFKALASYHAKRTSGELKAYWERLAA